MPSKSHNCRDMPRKERSESEVELVTRHNSSSGSDGNDDGVFCSESERNVNLLLPRQQQQQQQYISPNTGYKNVPESSGNLAARSVSVRSASTVASGELGSDTLPSGLENRRLSSANNPGVLLYSTPGAPHTMVPRTKYQTTRRAGAPPLPPNSRSNLINRAEIPPSLPPRHLNQNPRQPQPVPSYHCMDEDDCLPNPLRDARETVPPTPPCRRGQRSPPSPPSTSPPHHRECQGTPQPFSPPERFPLPDPPTSPCYETERGGILLPFPPRGQGRKKPGHVCLRRRYLLVVTGVSLAVALSSVVTLILFMMGVLRPVQAERDLDIGQEACIPCQELSVTANNEYIKALAIRPDKDSGKMCCFNSTNSNQVAALVGLLIDKRKLDVTEIPKFSYSASESRGDQLVAFASVSAHIRLLGNAKSAAPSEDSTDLRFDLGQNKETGHIHGFRVHKNRLTILYNGWYFVYSSVMFGIRLNGTKGCHELKSQTWKQYVKRSVEGESGSKILVAGFTNCCEKCAFHSSTSYTGGMFYLNRTDQLHVEVKSSARVIGDKHASFLGIAMVGSRTIVQKQDSESQPSEGKTR